MYIYEYESVSAELSGYGLFGGAAWGNDETHRSIIDRRAREGWRYVGFFPTSQRGTGHIEQMDLIFEKEL